MRTAPLSELVDLTLSSVDKKSKPGEQEVQLCNYMDVYNNNFIDANLDFMKATASEREIARCSLAAGDVVITKDSETHDDIGVPALVREDIPDLVCGYHLAILRPKPSKVSGPYLYYALQAQNVQHQFHSFANGITRFGLRKSDIELAEILTPPLAEQQAIAHVLGTLDDKIELNQRTNQTLEAMARAIFQDWFVDFGPTRAKMEGLDPYLPPELSGLFPDELVDSELGEIPAGWEIKNLGQVVEVLGGATPSTKRPEYWEGGIHCWATPKDLSNIASPVLLDTERKITDAGLNKISSGLLPPGTLLLSSRAPIGYLAISEAPVAINQGFIAMPPTDAPSNWYMMLWCKASHEKIISHANGSTFLEISKANFRKIPMALPDSELLFQFDKFVGSLYRRVAVNQRESQTMATKRDELLPMLLSGELKPEEREY